MPDHPTAAIVVIGNEILSGRTREGNAHYLAKMLNAHGICLCEIRVVADQQALIVAAVNALRVAYDYVFTSGGIGPTPDDITADAVAAAFGVPLLLHADAKARLEQYYKDKTIDLNTARLRMARIPKGASLIDNPISAAVGFCLGNVYVMAGVPAVFEAMAMHIVPTLPQGTILLSRTIRVEQGEGDIAETLSRFVAQHPDLQIGCYPIHLQHASGYAACVVVRGYEASALDTAVADLRADLAKI